MKKLMIAAAIVCAAVMSQAANYKWKATGGNMYIGGTETKYTGTAYFFDSSKVSMQALYEAFAEDSSAVASKSIASLAVSEGSFVTSPTGANQFEYGTEESGIQKFSFYFALVDGDNLYLSNAINDKSITAPPAATTIGFASQNNGSTTFSKTAPANEFVGAGYWQTVPEPTSGLLLLLGVAGLALRRRRA